MFYSGLNTPRRLSLTFSLFIYQICEISSSWLISTRRYVPGEANCFSINQANLFRWRNNRKYYYYCPFASLILIGCCIIRKFHSVRRTACWKTNLISFHLNSKEGAKYQARTLITLFKIALYDSSPVKSFQTWLELEWK